MFLELLLGLDELLEAREHTAICLLLGKAAGHTQQASQLKQSRTSVSGQNGNGAGDRSVNLGQRVESKQAATDLTAGFQAKAALH